MTMPDITFGEITINNLSDLIKKFNNETDIDELSNLLKNINNINLLI